MDVGKDVHTHWPSGLAARWHLPIGQMCLYLMYPDKLVEYQNKIRRPRIDNE